MTGARTRPAAAAGTAVAALVATHGRRRLAAAVLAAPAVAVGAGLATGGLPTGDPGRAVVLAALGLIGGALLATYLPVTGAWYRPVLGCTRCAVGAGLTLPLAVMLLSSDPTSSAVAMMALAAVTFGLAQRLRDPVTCPTR